MHRFTTIEVAMSVQGIHRWPGVPVDSKVGFLGNPHRHLFKITVEIEVSHDNRQLEFFQVQEQITRVLRESYSHDGLSFDFIHHSCEMVAVEVLDGLAAVLDLHDTQMTVAVSEDGENAGKAYQLHEASKQ